MVEGALRLVLGGIVLLLIAIVILALQPGQPWTFVAVVLGLGGVVVAVVGFLRE